MTVTDQLKIIDNKIKANQAQYDLDRLAAKISAYSSGDLRKYEYLNGEDLVRPKQLVRLLKMKVIINTTINFLFKGFKETLEKIKRISLDSEYNEINDFYTLSNTFSNTYKATTTKKTIPQKMLWKNLCSCTTIILIFTKKITTVEV